MDGDRTNGITEKINFRRYMEYYGVSHGLGLDSPPFWSFHQHFTSGRHWEGGEESDVSGV